jgi:uncharacterized protein YndB with AHSA1/START domain
MEQKNDTMNFINQSTMATKSSAVNDPEKKELSITRILNAPRELVWEVWTHPEHIAQWWGPNGFTNTIHHMDVKPGGEWNFIMHGPDGTDYPNKIVFNKIIKPGLITFTNLVSPEFNVTVTFKKYGSKTKLTMQMIFNSTKDYHMAVDEHGATEGLEQNIGRLSVYVEKMSKK